MERLNGVSSDRVKEQTGYGWAEWIELLDKKNAADLDHKAIVEIVSEEVPRPWWAQMVTVGYEQAKGRRVQNQTVEGFQVSVSKTYDHPVPKVYQAWNSFLGQWYDGPEFTLTTNNMNKNLRGKFADDSVFEARLLETKTGKAQLTVEQSKLTTATGAEEARASWKRQLDQLAEYLP